ncbi:MAG TPA: LLM class F420-dependent oxidoreductase [Acidimicrobiia bacterium]|nr:LLM class F420-dependent oxidoreductase [Acidimicrobiia bacterium]
MTRFGLQLPNFTLGVPDEQLFDRVVELAVTAEDSGFASLWVMDHLYQLPALGGADQPMLEAYTLLGALAARTSRAELGTLVTGVTYRNPALVAKIITTLDIISRGRAVLGIGAAWHDIEHVAYGFDFPPAKERLDRLEEAVQICRAMFTEHAPTFEGRYYRIHEAQNLPRPLQPGGPPIMIGGGGERRTLRLVAQYADRCNVSGDLPTVRHKVEVLHQHCADVGRDPTEIRTTRLGSLFLADSAAQAEETRSMLVGLAGAEFVDACTIGTEDEVVDQVAAIIDAGIDEPIFNLPFAEPDVVGRAAKLLTGQFG